MVCKFDPKNDMNDVYMSNLFMVERHLTLHLDIKHRLMKYIVFIIFLPLLSQSPPFHPSKRLIKSNFLADFTDKLFFYAK